MDVLELNLERLNAIHASFGTGSLIHGIDSNYFGTFLK